MIFADCISFSYDGKASALSGVSLRVAPGEFLCIAGGNGSGKSTLAKLLCGLMQPTEGTISCNGQAALVFQNPDDAIVESIVEDEVAFGPSNLGLPPDQLRMRVTESLRTVGLEGFESRQVDTLSGGQKQRLAVAGALASSPDVLILDEATSMLDPRGRSSIMSLARSLAAQGMAVIAITHFAEEMLLADRLVVLHEGRVAAEGCPQDLLRDEKLVNAVGLLQPRAAQLGTMLSAYGVPVSPTCDEHTLKEALCNLRFTR